MGMECDVVRYKNRILYLYALTAADLKLHGYTMSSLL